MSELDAASPPASPRNSPPASPGPPPPASPLVDFEEDVSSSPQPVSVDSGSELLSAETSALAFNKLLKGDYPKYRSPDEVKDGRKRLRGLVLAHGIPVQADATLRVRVWKVLLQLGTLNSDAYLDLIRQGPSPKYGEKLRNDTFRTMATDLVFKERVPEAKLIRLLDAFALKHEDVSNGGNLSFTYVQGMNVLAAPFLYVMPSEIEAFYSFSSFIEGCCPLYVQPSLEGAHQGAQLLDRCLELLDKELYDNLCSKSLTAQIYALPSILTFCACTPPLDQVMQLWDFLLAYGVHVNILCIIAQLFLVREQLMDDTKNDAAKLKRGTFPPLDARQIVALAVTLVRDIPAELYDELVKHPWERSTA